MKLKIIKKLESNDKNKTIKYLFKTIDNNIFESVIMFENVLTLCVSSQIGCPVKCRFCRTGKDKFLRNLDVYEIIEQVKLVEKDMGRKIECISYMGMGEPLLNINNILFSMKKLNKRKYKLSTVVIPGNLLKLSDLNIPIEIYISLHASSETTRKHLIPFSNSTTIEKLIEEVNEFSKIKKIKTSIFGIFY